MKQHTIIVGVQGDRMKVVEQNTVMEKTVAEGMSKLADMLSGTIQIFRPVGQSWCPNIKDICKRW